MNFVKDPHRTPDILRIFAHELDEVEAVTSFGVSQTLGDPVAMTLQPDGHAVSAFETVLTIRIVYRQKKRK